MKYNCFIVDDEPLAIEVIENHLSKLEQFEVTGTFTDPIKAFMAAKKGQIDLLFIDIEMPEFNGLNFIKSLTNRPEIIITTAYREYAVEGFELDILDYLVKPIAFDRFIKSINKFLNIRQELSDTVQQDFIMVRSNRKHVKVDLANILYIEGLKDYVKIVLPDQTILTKESIGNFNKHLDDRFIRIHKSYVVAIDKISAITAYDVEIDKTELPIGRIFKDNLMQKVTNK